MRRSALKETILRSSWIAEVRGVAVFALLVGLSASALLLFIGPARAVAAEDMVIHWQGRFYDGALHVIDPAVLSASRRLVLAIAPDLSITEAMVVREKITAANLEVTTIDARWLHILEERDL